MLLLHLQVAILRVIDAVGGRLGHTPQKSRGHKNPVVKSVNKERKFGILDNHLTTFHGVILLRTVKVAFQGHCLFSRPLLALQCKCFHGPGPLFTAIHTSFTRL